MSKLVEQSTAITAGQLPSEPIPDFTIEVPADRSHGDWATNVAMVSAKAFKLAPRKIAEAVASHIVLDNSYFKSCEIAGPGFLNFFLNEQFYVDVVKEVIAEGDNYGHSDFGCIREPNRSYAHGQCPRRRFGRLLGFCYECSRI